MNFKKKRRILDLLKAALVIVLFVGVPIWLFVIASILEDPILFFIDFLWLYIPYRLEVDFDA